MKAELICVGTELLMGQILNTNAQFISRRLADMGVDVYVETTVGDNAGRLEESMRASLARADVVITTGGLGPTMDDLTKETAAKLMGKSLAYDEASLHALKRRFFEMHREMTPNNLKQAMFPPDARILPNPMGTAPGCIMEAGGKAIILLPGPPREMEPMFEHHVRPYLEARSGAVLHSRVLRIFGMGESSVEHTLRAMMEEQKNPTLALYAKTGEVTLRITAKCASAQEGEAMLAPVLAAVQKRLGNVVYSTDDEELHEVCIRRLLARGETLSVAESCTGGMLASRIVDVAGCSACFLQGVVAYSNEAKAARLGVRDETLRRCGAVSEETAREMAEGMRKSAQSDYALATTGIAGPEGGTEEKPVGLVYVALSTKDGTKVQELRLGGKRDRIRAVATLHALDMLRRELEKEATK